MDRRNIVAQRDAWVLAGPERNFTVSVDPTASPARWCVILTEGEHVVAAGNGISWELALEEALRAAPQSEDAGHDSVEVAHSQRVRRR